MGNPIVLLELKQLWVLHWDIVACSCDILAADRSSSDPKPL